MTSKAQFMLTHTIGINEVLEIEKLAEQRRKDLIKLDNYSKSLDSLKKLKKINIANAQDELLEMKKRRDAEIIELKLGYFCNKCHVFKSEMEKKGENFEAHLKSVSGYPVPAPDSEITSKRSEWTEKIAIKTVALNNLIAGQTKEELACINNMDTIKKYIDLSCNKIYELAELYTSKVFNEHKEVLIVEINKAMRVAAYEMIAWNEYVLNLHTVDSLKHVLINQNSNLSNQTNINKNIKFYTDQQSLKEQRAKQFLKSFVFKCDSVKSANDKYYELVLKEVNRMDLARSGWCGQSNRVKILPLNNNFNTLTDCMYFIRIDFDLLKTDCTSNWDSFKQVYLSFFHSLYPYQVSILLNDKNRYINKIWLTL